MRESVTTVLLHRLLHQRREGLRCQIQGQLARLDFLGIENVVDNEGESARILVSHTDEPGDLVGYGSGGTAADEAQ
jgi:hypothetical protein